MSSITQEQAQKIVEFYNDFVYAVESRDNFDAYEFPYFHEDECYLDRYTERKLNENVVAVLCLSKNKMEGETYVCTDVEIYYSDTCREVFAIEDIEYLAKHGRWRSSENGCC